MRYAQRLFAGSSTEDHSGRTAARTTLSDLHHRQLNYDPRQRITADDGWNVDDYRQALPSEPPGPPLPGGSWEIARRLVRDYEFADPAIIHMVQRRGRPAEGRDLLLEARFYGLSFYLGVRVGGVVDEVVQIDGRDVRVWGWNYQTLQGHLEMGRMAHEVRKWLDTGEVEFHLYACSRPAPIAPAIVRLGFRLFGRRMQSRFHRRACKRMARFTQAELAGKKARVRGRRRFLMTDRDVFPFHFAAAYRLPALLFGITPRSARVTVGSDSLEIRFGPWHLTTGLDNVAGVEEVEGPYSFVKTAGPAHLSFVDRGITFATNGAGGVCIRFRTPVPAIDPVGLVRHPAATVTVARPRLLCDLLSSP